jgi:hypothetical protein
MYQASVPAFLQTLNNLSAILDKAEAYAGNRKIDPEVLLNYRLAPDMLPFVRQIQIAADLAKGAAARLADVEVPKHDDTEKTFADLKARITNTVTFRRPFETGRHLRVSGFLNLRVSRNPTLVVNGIYDEMIPVQNSYWLSANPMRSS